MCNLDLVLPAPISTLLLIFLHCIHHFLRCYTIYIFILSLVCLWLKSKSHDHGDLRYFFSSIVSSVSSIVPKYLWVNEWMNPYIIRPKWYQLTHFVHNFYSYFLGGCVCVCVYFSSYIMRTKEMIDFVSWTTFLVASTSWMRDSYGWLAFK